MIINFCVSERKYDYNGKFDYELTLDKAKIINMDNKLNMIVSVYGDEPIGFYPDVDIDFIHKQLVELFGDFMNNEDEYDKTIKYNFDFYSKLSSDFTLKMEIIHHGNNRSDNDIAKTIYKMFNKKDI